jgi:hypothetical protein
MSDLATKCPQSVGLLARAVGKKPRFWEAFIPILLELLEQLMAECFDDAEEFTQRVRKANWFNMLRLKAISRRAMRRADVPGRLGGKAEALAGDILTECKSASDAELGACYRELAA